MWDKPKEVINLNAKTGPAASGEIKCPQCSTRDPGYRMMELSSFYLRGRVIEERVTGYGVECQRCGHVYCISESGAWTPDPKSTLGRQLAMKASHYVAPIEPGGDDPKPDIRLDRQPDPVPKRRPTV